MDASKQEKSLVVVSPASMPIPVAISDEGDRASERFFTLAHVGYSVTGCLRPGSRVVILDEVC